MKKVVLAPYVSCGFRVNGDLSFGFGSLQRIVTGSEKIRNILEAASFLKTPRDKLEIEKFKKNEEKSFAINFITDHPGCVIDVELLKSNDRYHRQLLFFALKGLSPEISQKSLASKHVVILGCGGIGNHIAYNLASSGVGKLTLIDADEIELTNLTRQLMFTEADIGKLKSSCLKKALSERNSTIEIVDSNLSISSENDLYSLPTNDLIILSADTPSSIIYWTNNYAIKTETPFINVGYVLDVSIIGPFVIPGKTGCISCGKLFANSNVDPHLLSLTSMINKGYQAPSIGPINMIASGIASLDCLNYLSGSQDILTINKRMGYWSHTGSIEIQEANRNKECHACSHLPD